LVSPIPSIIHDGNSYAIRSAFAIVPFVGLSALGFYNAIRLIRSKYFYALLGVLLVLSLFYFSVTYLYRYSILSTDQYMLNYRLLSSYLTRSIEQQPTIVLTGSSYQFFRDYLFYSDSITKANAGNIQNQFTRGLDADYRLNNLLVTSSCEILKSPPQGTIIVDTLSYTGCLQSYKEENSEFKSDLENWKSIGIRSPIDSREYFRIYNPSFCQGTQFPKFIIIKELKSLGIEQLSNEDFCSTWLF
jgi:hypothetical protein